MPSGLSKNDLSQNLWLELNHIWIRVPTPSEFAWLSCITNNRLVITLSNMYRLASYQPGVMGSIKVNVLCEIHFPLSSCVWTQYMHSRRHVLKIPTVSTLFSHKSKWIYGLYKLRALLLCAVALWFTEILAYLAVNHGFHRIIWLRQHCSTHNPNSSKWNV